MNITLKLFALVLFFEAFSYGQTQTPLAVGQPAPNFSLDYATKDSVIRTPLKLSDFAGKRNVVLAFYPADWSGGCTKEVCTLRDDFRSLDKLNAEILAISGDYVWSHFEWAKHHDLPFKLLSDHGHEVAKTYSSYNEKSGYNRRTVFVINKEGRIAYIDLEYKVSDGEDFAQLKSALAQIQ